MERLVQALHSTGPLTSFHICLAAALLFLQHIIDKDNPHACQVSMAKSYDILTHFCMAADFPVPVPAHLPCDPSPPPPPAPQPPSPPPVADVAMPIDLDDVPQMVQPPAPPPVTAPSVVLAAPAAPAPGPVMPAKCKGKGRQQAPVTPPSVPSAPPPVAVHPPQPTPPSYANMAAAPAPVSKRGARPHSPPLPATRPSLVISLPCNPINTGQTLKASFNTLAASYVPICNNILASSNMHASIRMSAAKWTVKGNLVVTAGPDVTSEQLTAAAPLITSAVQSCIPSSSPPCQTHANVKWSQVLINGVPTGVTDTHTAHTPQVCHQALLTENPQYRPLWVSQLPS